METTPPQTSTDSRATDFASGTQPGQALDAAWRHCATEGQPLSVLAIEVDNLESVSSRSDRKTTEAWLEAFSRALRVHCNRPGDTVQAIWGGKFMAILPGTYPAGARHVGEAILEAARDLNKIHADDFSGAAITVSVGITSTAPGHHGEASEMIPRANRALQRARDLGGNRINGGASISPSAKDGDSFLSILRNLFSTERAPGRQRRGDS